MRRRIVPSSLWVALPLLLLGACVEEVPVDELDEDEGADDAVLAAGEQIFYAVADTEVRRASPTTSYGSLKEIGADTSPVRHAYLRFDLRGLTGTVKKASLGCNVINGTPDGPEVYATSSSWSEGSMTWNNRPAVAGARLFDVGSAAVNTWLQFDVTPAVKAGEQISFVLVPTSGDAMGCTSREGSAKRPKLYVELNETTTPPEPPPPGGTTLGGRPLLTNLPAPTGYALAWSDEFDGAAVDSTKWNLLNNSNYGSANEEDQCLFARNAEVSGGRLRLIAKRETVACGATNPNTGTSTYQFTSAFLTTRAMGGTLKKKFRYGYVEASIKNPKGNPFWSGFWLVGPNDGSTPGWPDYGEFDISEVTPIKPDVTHGTLWYRSTTGNGHTSPNLYNVATRSPYAGSSNLGTTQTTANLATYDGPTTSRFVRYGFLWEPDRVTWYVDGVPFRTFDGKTVVRINADGTTAVEKTVGVNIAAPSIPFSTVFAYEHSINLNLSVGGAFPQDYGYSGIESGSGYADGNLAAAFPNAMEVEYVRVYQTP